MSNRVEPKVKVSAIVQYLMGLSAMGVLSGVGDGNLISALPDWATAILTPVLPVVAALVAAYNTRHQYRRTEPVPSGS